MKTVGMTKPKKPVIIYDGECNFCINGVRRIQEKDKANQFIYTLREAPDLHVVYPQLDAVQSKAGMRFIDLNGKVHCGADAIYQIYRRLRKSGYITWIYLVPVIRTVLKGVYLIISKNRSRFGHPTCESEACSENGSGGETADNCLC